MNAVPDFFIRQHRTALLFEHIGKEQEKSAAQKAYEIILQLSPEKQYIMLELISKATELI